MSSIRFFHNKKGDTNPGVDAVGHGDVDEAVGTANGDGGLGAVLGEGVQAGAGAATQDDGCIEEKRY